MGTPVVPGPTVIVNPTPASGLTVRRPRVEVWIAGYRLPFVLELTTTRGLDQPMATAEITYPHPLPDFVKFWAEVKILATDDDGVMQQRFFGYVTAMDQSLWPGAKTIRCQDILAIAANTFTREPLDLHTYTDPQAIQAILAGCSYNIGVYGYTITSLTGTGTVLADVEEAVLAWDIGVTGLEAIAGIDEISLGWRTYGTASGLIARTQIVTNPNFRTEAYTFAEGVDILDGSASVEIVDPKNEITVTGFDGSVTATLDESDDPFGWWHNSYWIRFLALQTQARHLGILNPQDVAEYILSQVAFHLIKVTFTTHRAVLFNAQEVIHVTSERLEVDQNFYVQSVQFTAGADGSISQTITGVSRMEPTNRHLVVPPVDTSAPTASPVGTDAPVAPPGTTVPPGVTDLLASFTIVGIDHETAAPAELPDDTGTDYYIVAAQDTTTSISGTIVSQAWTAAGPGVRITSGSGPTFTTAFTDLTDATITLTVTDSNGSEASVTLPANPGNQAIRSRKLYALTDSTYEAYNGDAWVTKPPVVPSKVQCVGGGPVWGADHYVVISTDDLATAPTETAVLPPGEDVTAIWLHEANNNLIAVGGAAGSVAVTTDGGATWALKTSLGEAVNGIIISIFHEQEFHVVTPSGWLTSTNGGESWDLVRAGNFLYLELSHSRNIIVDSDGVLQKAEDGTPFTGNTNPIQAATAHIREDRFAAIALDGSTWVVDTPGSYTLVAAEPIPSGAVLPGACYRDGNIVNMLFYAAGTGGIFKSFDFLQTANGYLRLRADGRITP
jgi:hypothetical protein